MVAETIAEEAVDPSVCMECGNKAKFKIIAIHPRVRDVMTRGQKFSWESCGRCLAGIITRGGHPAYTVRQEVEE